MEPIIVGRGPLPRVERVMSTSAFEPVLVGIAQLEQRDADPVTGTGEEPLELMIDAVRAAAEDAGAPGILAGADAVRVTRGMWPYENPAKAVADAIGCPGAETGVSMWGGDAGAVDADRERARRPKRCAADRRPGRRRVRSHPGQGETPLALISNGEPHREFPTARSARS